MDKVLIIGASGHGKVIIEAIELNKEYEIVGFVDSFKDKGEKVLGYEILGKEDIIPDLVQRGVVTKGVIAIGDNWTRGLMYNKVKDLVPDFEYITVIHPDAIVSPYSTIGRGTVILASGTVNTDAVVGDFCIINTNANFGHDGIMQDFSSLAPGVTTGGTVYVGEYTAVSIGVSVIQNTSIGKHSVIGAGAVVTNEIKDYVVAYGVPAKVIRKRKKDDSYLTTPTLDTNFKAYKIKNKEDLLMYREVLKSLGNENPFYKVELLDTKEMTEHGLHCFILEMEGKPLIIMPFYLRNIVINDEETTYKDVTSPYGYSGPLFNENKVNESILKHFWKQVDLWYDKKNVVSEFIRFSLNNNHKEYSGTLIPSLKNVKGKIAEEQQQWEQFKPKVRNNYRKAQKEGLELKVYYGNVTLDIIKDFYDIYIQTMQRNNAGDQYFHYIDYFQNFIIENKNNVIIAMVYKDSIPISTELVLIDEKILYSYLGGTLSEYFFTRPNDFLKIEMLSWARQHNFDYYVLGGGRQDGDGLYKYKKSFFPNDEDVVYYTGRKIINKEVYNTLVSRLNSLELDYQEDSLAKTFFPLYRYTQH